MWIIGYTLGVPGKLPDIYSRSTGNLPDIYSRVYSKGHPGTYPVYALEPPVYLPDILSRVPTLYLLWGYLGTYPSTLWGYLCTRVTTIAKFGNRIPQRIGHY